MAKGNKGMPRGAGTGGGSIEFSSAAVARSGDWSDSMSDDSESEMLMLEKSSSGGSGSDSGSALPLDSIDPGALTLDALDRTKALAAKPAPGIASILPASDRQLHPVEPSTAAGGSKAPGGGTLGRVLAATQAYTQVDGGVDRKTFLAGLGDEEESESLPQSASKPPVPARRTGVKGKPAAYAAGAAAASAAVARADPGKKIALSLPSDGSGGVTPGKKPRVVTGTGSNGNEGVAFAVTAVLAMSGMLLPASLCRARAPCSGPECVFCGDSSQAGACAMIMMMMRPARVSLTSGNVCFFAAKKTAGLLTTPSSSRTGRNEKFRM